MVGNRNRLRLRPRLHTRPMPPATILPSGPRRPTAPPLAAEISSSATLWKATNYPAVRAGNSLADKARRH
jgi:hypothetical protein